MKTIITLAIAYFLTFQSFAQTTNYYRYCFSTKWQTVTFKEEINSEKAKIFKCYQVTKDQLGRIIKYTEISYGKTQDGVEYQYSDDTKIYPAKTKSYANDGSLRTYGIRVYNSNNKLISIDKYSADDKIICKLKFTEFSTYVEELEYGKKGNLSSKTRYFYTPTGIINKINFYPNSSNTIYSEHFFDNVTGLETSGKQYYYDRCSMITKSMYDSNGYPIIDEAYAPQFNMKKYSTDYYENDLFVKRLYEDLYDNSKFMCVPSYNKKRELTEYNYYRNDKLVARIIYQRDSNGILIKAVCYNNKNELFAEYPDCDPIPIEKDGSPHYKTCPDWKKIGVGNLW